MTEMNPEPTTSPDPHPDARQRRWPGRPLVIATAAVVLGGAGLLATGAAIAATDEPSPSPSAATDDDSLRDRLRERFGMQMHGGPFGGMHGPFGGIRGQQVVPDGDGGYRTVLSQTGEVTAVSGDSLTVRSEDGYERSYAVTEDTSVNGGRDGIGDVEVDDQVSVTALREGGTDTAVRVIDVSSLRGSAERWRTGPFGHGWDDEETSTEGTATGATV